MYFDESKCIEGNGVGIVFVVPNDQNNVYLMRLNFYYNNNIIKYKELY